VERFEKKEQPCRLRGEFILTAHYVKGEKKGQREVLVEDHNIITDVGLELGIGAIGGLGEGIKKWQFGEGLSSWDTTPPAEDPATTALVTPIAPVKAINVRYWDDVAEDFSVTPTDTLDVRAVFNADDANGDLREFTIWGTATEDVMFNYVIHDKIVKTDVYNLECIIRFTLERTP